MKVLAMEQRVADLTAQCNRQEETIRAMIKDNDVLERLLEDVRQQNRILVDALGRLAGGTA